MSEPPAISVLIGTRDRREPLLRCLTSVQGQSYRDHEILVLDDCSRHLDVKEFVARHAPDDRVRCVRSERQLGVAGGRNLLMRRARGDILVTLDDDAVFDDSHCLGRVVDAFAERPEVGALAFRVMTHRAGREEPHVPFSRRRLRQDATLVSTSTRVSYYLGTGHALRTRVLAQTGLYQDDFIFYDEELDLAYRLVRAGFELLYCPDIVVHHHPASSVLDRSGHTERYYA